MNTPKTTVRSFLIFKYGEKAIGWKRPLFNRELSTLFKEYREWYRDNHYGKNPSGVKEHLFKKWLIENNCFFIPKRGKR